MKNKKQNIINIKTNAEKKQGRLVSADGLENCVSGMGTLTDKRSYIRYKSVRTLTMQELNDMYRQSWLCKRIINIVPDDMTRKWRTHNLDNAKKIKKIQLLEKSLQVRSKFIQAMYWARLYGGSLMIMITDDIDFNNPETCETPLDLNKIKKGSLKSLLVYDRWRAWAGYELISDISSAEFEMPEFYRITSNPQVNVNAPRFHHSRVIRFDGEKIPYYSFVANARWHDSVLQHVFDSVINNESAHQSTSMMMDEANIDVYKYAGLRENLADRADGEALVQKRLRITNMGKSINNAIVLDAEDSYDKKATSFANLDNLLNQYNINVCGAAKIPMTKLFGQSEGGLNTTGESDENKYYDDLMSSQENDLRPQLEKLDQVLIRSCFGTYIEDYSFEFPSLWQESDFETAQMRLNDANRDQIYLANGVISPKDVADKLLTEKVYNNITIPKELPNSNDNKNSSVENKNNNKNVNNNEDKSK